MSEHFHNYAGRDDVDDLLRAELEAAGIHVHDLGSGMGCEVETGIFGALDPFGWGFTRAWSYWVADGPGIPPDVAERLHATHGTEVRVDGHCACPSPLEWHKGFAVGKYHVDTQGGLNALAETIRGIGAEFALRRKSEQP